ncbi:MAG: transcriptional repressor [Thermoleophilia bacterium]
MNRHRIDSDQALLEALHHRGQRVTTQRVVLYRALRELDRHLTAEQLLAAVADRLPALSLPTVYATLDLFEELDLVRRVPVPGGPLLYDPRAEPHHHLACRRCGRVEDLDCPLDARPAVAAAGERGWDVADVTAVLSGTCPTCRNEGRVL